MLEHFLTEAALKLGKKKPTPPKELAVLLSTYNFPGNIRELEAMVYDAVSQHNGRTLSMKSFLLRIDSQGDYPSVEQPPLDANPFTHLDNLPTLQQAGYLLIDEAMQRSTGNQSIAARLLGISQPALSKRLK